MIPVKLQLQNFMAYKTPETLDFSDFHIACLTGENGAGKSSILDAITWVLWGNARTNSADDLIYLGESEMEIEFIFDLAGERYRVLRRRKSSRSGKSELHFHIWDAGGWRTLSESSIRASQAKINRLLRVDYDTFINSAFLLQGRANEFTSRKPAERKEILRDILGFGIYDEYEEKARQKALQYAQEIKLAEGQLVQIEQEIANEALYRQEWEASKNKASLLKKQLRQTETNLDTLRHQHKELDIKHRQLTDLRERLQQTQTDIDQLAALTARLLSQISEYQTIVARKTEIEAGFAKLKAAQAKQEDWNERLAQSSSLSSALHQAENIVNQTKTRLEAELKHKQTRRHELELKVATISQLKAESETLQTELDSLQTLESERERQQDQLNSLNTETARLEEENKQLRTEMEKIKERLTQLEEAGSICPVCTQPLSEAHRQTVKSEFETDGTAKGDAFRANTARLKAIKQEQDTLQTSLKQAAKTLKKRPTVERQQAQLEQKLLEAETAQESLAALNAELATLKNELESAQFEPEARAKIAEITLKLAELGYDTAQHQSVKKEVAELARFAEEQRILQDAQTRLDETSERLKAEEARYTRLLSQTTADRETVARLNEETKDLPRVARDLSAANAKVDEIQREERLARDAVAAARQKLDHVANLAKSRAEKEETLAELKQTEALYRELRAAFGKNGVQALLIEHAIPELEDEANNLLARMTDGRVNLQFITQREARSSDNMIDTLDIRIADELGTRNYDLYSGGEAFRVNFAIRIALSKLLARRAGANLQTLVIDEGFGTQDAQGRERLVEAIRSIEPDFEKIIVITHIDELKDAFPTEINVQKTPQGSTIQVV